MKTSIPRLCAVLGLSAVSAANVLAQAPAAAKEGQTASSGGIASLSEDEAVKRTALLQRLAAAASEAEGRAVESAIWRFWLGLAPDMQSRVLVERAMARREEYALEEAERFLDRAIERAPGYAAAWNQRAFVRFLREEYEGALEDLHRTLELEPKHFGALSGLFHVLFRQGRARAANAALVKAVEIHPWLKERFMLAPDPGAEHPAIEGRERDL